MKEFKTLKIDQLENKIAILVGTRPGIIKMSPLVQELESRNTPCLLIHAGQHYSYEMDRRIFNDINLRDPDYKIADLDKLKYHGEQTAEMLRQIEQILLKERPRALLVCGDANTNLAGALAARKLNIQVGHVESGLRSHDWRMPEEHNRVMIDHISEFLFAPTKQCVENLLKESVKGKILMTGNTIVDALYRNIDIARQKSEVLSHLGLAPDSYTLVTLHREENVDNEDLLHALPDFLLNVINQTQKKVLFPVHPRTKKNLVAHNLYEALSQIPDLILLPPQGYLDFLLLLCEANLVLTDSGGIQEEACILKIPCITLRANTERPETLDVKANILANIDKQSITQAINYWKTNSNKNWENPYGDGLASKRIIDCMLSAVAYS